MCPSCARVGVLSSKEILFFSADLFPVKYQTGEAANSQQGGAGSGKGEKNETDLWYF